MFKHRQIYIKILDKAKEFLYGESGVAILFSMRESGTSHIKATSAYIPRLMTGQKNAATIPNT